MITRERLKKDVAWLVRIAYQHLPHTVERFFSAIREFPNRLDDAIGSLPDICYTQASAMVGAGRKLGLSDDELCRIALAAQREERCGMSAFESTPEESPRPLYSDELEALGYCYQI